MSVRVGINGFGRMGRLALRAAWGWPELEFVHVNEIQGGAETAAHLLTFDSVHGRWREDVPATDERAEGRRRRRIGYSSRCASRARCLGRLGVEVVLECSGKFRTPRALDAYFRRGVKQGHRRRARSRTRALNIVVGVNDHSTTPASTTCSPPPRAPPTASRRW